MLIIVTKYILYVVTPTKNVDLPVNDEAARQTVKVAGRSVENAKIPALDERNCNGSPVPRFDLVIL